jgi:DNA-binding MarR family transcriptional regulator
METGNTPFPGLWLTVTELAERLGLAKSAVSKRLKRFEDTGTPIATRPGKGNALLVNVAEYERAVGTSGDQARTLATKPPSDEPESVSASYTREQAREKSYAAELKRLDLEERLGKLLPVAELAAIAGRVGEALVAAIERLPGLADDCAAAVARDGAQGARSFLKTTAFELRETLSKALDELATTARAEHAAEGAADAV